MCKERHPNRPTQPLELLFASVQCVHGLHGCGVRYWVRNLPSSFGMARSKDSPTPSPARFRSTLLPRDGLGAHVSNITTPVIFIPCRDTTIFVLLVPSEGAHASRSMPFRLLGRRGRRLRTQHPVPRPINQRFNSSSRFSDGSAAVAVGMSGSIRILDSSSCKTLRVPSHNGVLLFAVFSVPAT